VSARHLWALTYDYVPDMLERRVPHRGPHLALVAAWHERGEIVVAGALGNPPHGALFAFDVADPARIEDFIAADPYVEAGLVTGRRIEAWSVVAGLEK
jgi:uncharacterized protein